jgi:ATP-dependent DNA ligase
MVRYWRSSCRASERENRILKVPTTTKARFIEPMLLLRMEKLPKGSEWQIELKLDGYRELAFKTGGKVHLRSRNDNDFNTRYPGLVKALASMPDETVIDGEVVALDADGRPSFNTLQNYGSGIAPLHFFMFDLLVLKGKDVTAEPLRRRREMMESSSCRIWLTRSGILLSCLEA